MEYNIDKNYSNIIYNNNIVQNIFNFPGLVEYEAALKLDPHNEKLKTDAEKIRVYIQTSHAES